MAKEVVEQKYYSVKDAAKILGISYQQMYKLAYEGHIESFVLGGTHTRRISKESLDRYIERSMHENAPSRA